MAEGSGMRSSGKVAIVMGGAGGVGRALVRKPTREGAAVTAADVAAKVAHSRKKKKLPAVQ
jgi:NAD(P)-dependent dehydrogenase (short-subunit alcohol dehydrogenase family)